MALSIDYMLQNGYNLVVIFTKHKYPSELKVWMEIVTDGTRTDLVQFTQKALTKGKSGNRAPLSYKPLSYEK